MCKLASNSVVSVFELEIWSQPNRVIGDLAGNELEKLLQEMLNCDKNMVAGRSFIPSEVDVTNLKIAMKERKFSALEFYDFCKSKNLPVDMSNPLSSARFLEYRFGRLLVLINLPYSQEAKPCFPRIIQWALDNSYVVVGSFVRDYDGYKYTNHRRWPATAYI